MEEVPVNEIESVDAIYLPHHAVVKNDKDTTKVRVVFDASCKGTNGRSLNDYMLVGPALQSELRHIMIRWRTWPICLSADVVKMYRQIRVNKQDINFQRLLWQIEDQIKHYRLLRVTFGTASAPYLAIKTLQQIAEDEENRYPVAAGRVRTDFYMDDLLTGCQDKAEGIKIYKEMNDLLIKGGFELQKWTTNDNELLIEMKESRKTDDLKEELKIKTDDIIKIVGLTWNRRRDAFHYTVKLPDLKEPITKRKIISDISRFYDPLGWVAPCTILFKIIIQKLWLTGIDWDEIVPEKILQEWIKYRNELTILTEIEIPRWIGTKASDVKVELHGFCDASQSAYGAVVYARVVDLEGNVRVTLISAKTKVAPVKQVSVPRLELCGAVLLTKLLIETAKVLNIQKTYLHAWTDSTVVLAWINSHPNRWKVFVANRVSEILTNLDSHYWSHVGTKCNPADHASRGLYPSELKNNVMWFEGPRFLHDKEILYVKPKDIETELETAKVHITVTTCFIWDKYSSLNRLVRIIAYCRRFLNIRKGRNDTSRSKYLSAKELSDALETCVRQCQREHFLEVFSNTNSTMKTNRLKGPLKPLNPFIDQKGLLRVGGRLEHSQLSYNQKHPLLIPKQSSLTTLLIADAHMQTLHGGLQLTLSYLQSKFWILGGKQLVKSYCRKCVTCIKNAGTTQSQLMGQLPSSRVTPTRPFKHSGVDYAGPIQIRTTKGRGFGSYKGYICLFVCMVTRAVHIEVVSDLTSEGFLSAYKRFVARRGSCTELWSDNGTNFVGAAVELKKLFHAENKAVMDEVAESLAILGCTWRFIPPHAPNFGGLWERGIRSVKYHLKRIIGNSTLTYEEMATVLIQIEACLNSRPQSVLNDDPDSLNVLTPGHFLIGEPLRTAPDYDFTSSNVSSLRRWQYTHRIVQDFWHQWSKEYLIKFFHRYRWASQTPQPNLGDVVVIKQEGLPPSRWLYGRIVAIHPGQDNIIRVVTLKTKNGCLKRPTSKLCILPIAK
ncbi:uncharacterized protein LOC131845442 [Achroia grisella]|uniref:uncharacterized protein LOC131845442 n=1 Tax=Achroia grisella TaxID=688607 RepID=UPI0027D22565|nr:uncharacterized protein LOC131845442 [Achroia grisella]